MPARPITQRARQLGQARHCPVRQPVLRAWQGMKERGALSHERRGGAPRAGGLSFYSSISTQGPCWRRPWPCRDMAVQTSAPSCCPIRPPEINKQISARRHRIRRYCRASGDVVRCRSSILVDSRSCDSPTRQSDASPACGDSPAWRGFLRVCPWKSVPGSGEGRVFAPILPYRRAYCPYSGTPHIALCCR